MFFNSKTVKANSETQTPAVFYAENGGAVSLTKNKPNLPDNAKASDYTVYETTISKKCLVVGNYFYFDIYTTHDFPLTVLDGATRSLYQNAYDHIRKFNSSTGIVVTAQLYNGNTEIAEELSYSHSELSYPLQSINVSYKGIETEIPLTVYEFTIQDAIVEVANAYDRQGGQIHYDQYQSRRH